MGQSVATGQFPQIAWQDGKKLLWNPIQRQRFKNRPEERIRLRIIEYLLHGGWSKHRISTEESLSAGGKTDTLRTDLICYSRGFDPLLLVECKAEQVKISGQTADQIARYNHDIRAPYLLMSNGLNDFWYNTAGGKTVAIESIPAPFPQPQLLTEQPLAYWKERGFAGDNAPPRLRKWLTKSLNAVLLQQGERTRFLSFNQSPSDLDLSNYYRILQGNGYRLALSFSSTPFGGSRLAGIINNNGQNVGVLEINLDLLFDERSPNATTYSAKGTENLDATDLINPDSTCLQPSEFIDAWQPLAKKCLE